MNFNGEKAGMKNAESRAGKKVESVSSDILEVNL